MRGDKTADEQTNEGISGGQKVRFDRLLKELSRKEPDLDKRIGDLKQMYELDRYDELSTRLKDAESKNEYLVKLIAELEAKNSQSSDQM